MTADVSDRKQVERIAQQAIARFGRIDSRIEVSEGDSRRLFDINFWGVVNGSLVALTYLLRHGGALINLGSGVSDAVVPMQGMYAASRHAVRALRMPCARGGEARSAAASGRRPVSGQRRGQIRAAAA